MSTRDLPVIRVLYVQNELNCCDWHVMKLADVFCDDASMMKMQKEIDADTNPGMKKQVDMANAEMKMATDAMHANKTDECAMHLNKAAKEFMSK